MRKLWVLFCVVTGMVSAQNQLNVNIGNEIRPVTHCASGSLYGVTETLPADIEEHVAPLNPHVFANPAVSGPGHQQPIGDALEVSRRLENTTGKVQVRFPDILPGWPYQWPGIESFLAQCSEVIDRKLASGRTNYDGYEIWNEPYGTYRGPGTFEANCWEPVYDLTRSKDPNERIIGPSFAYYNNSRMRTFLTYARDNDCLPDVVCWHQWGAGGFVNAYNQYRALEAELGISPRPISINEYSSRTSDPYEGCPGYSVPFIAKFERHGIESACLSWWWTGLPGRLGSLLTASNEKGGGWHLYKWYGDMTGQMVQVTPPNDFSDGLDGFGCIDEDQQYASICLGGDFTGNATVNINNIPAFFGSSVNVRLEYVEWVDKDTPVAGTNLISETVYNVNNGSITVPVNVTSNLYAYRIYIEPTNAAPQVAITLPTQDTVVINPVDIQLEAEVSDPSAINTLRFMVNGEQVGATEYQAPYFTTLSIEDAGVYEVTAVIDVNGNQISSPVRTIRTRVPQAAYDYEPHLIPGTIQFEEYDLGGNGFAYYDDSPGSETGVAFRNDEAVDLEECTDTSGGFNIGWSTAGEWLEYTVNVQEEGLYIMDVRIACNGDGRTLDLAINETPLETGIAIPNTGGWQSWQTMTIEEVNLPAGEHVLRFTIGEENYINLNYVTFTKTFVPEPPVISLDTPLDGSTYTTEESIAMSATASDPDGNVVGVSFFEGTNLLATSNTVPHTYEWSGMSPGVYEISATAYDTDGLETTSSIATITIQGVQKPFNDSPHNIPGKIEAEEYDQGGEGLAYHEANTNGNEGEADFRNDEVDIETTGDTEGTYNVGYILNGEWLEYAVNVAEAGLYDIDLRMAKDGDNGMLHIEMDGNNVTGTINVPNTGGWQTWQTVTVNDVELEAGEQVMRIAFDSDYMNLNYVTFTQVILDTDNDGTPDDEDGCPNDPDKIEPGICGCSLIDSDVDGDGIYDCNDDHPFDYDNDGINTQDDCDDTNPAIGEETDWYADTDNDGVGDASASIMACTQPQGYVVSSGDVCPEDGNKTAPGDCGCGNTEQSCLDCAGIPNGDAFYDNCDNCVEAQQEACTQDCYGDWGGTAAEDACGTCAGGSTSIEPVTNPEECIATGLDGEDLGDLKVYPNPTSAMLYWEKVMPWVLYSLDGRKLLSGDTSEVSMSTLTQGVYILSINNVVVKVVKK